jgi:hypothetical protein
VARRRPARMLSSGRARSAEIIQNKMHIPVDAGNNGRGTHHANSDATGTWLKVHLASASGPCRSLRLAVRSRLSNGAMGHEVPVRASNPSSAPIIFAHEVQWSRVAAGQGFRAMLPLRVEHHEKLATLAAACLFAV